MTKKKAAPKATSEAPESKPAAKKKILEITSEEEAIALIKKRFPQSPSNVSYIVLENCNIFYGYNRAPALKYAKTFGLKIFDVKT